MADISAIFGILILFGIAFPGMLFAWRLLFPATVERVRQRLELTPWKTLAFGMLISLLAAIPIVILLALPMGPVKLLGWASLALILAFSSLGSAGLAAKMAGALGQLSSSGPASAFIQGAFALELAVIFPVIGWFLVFPLVVFASIGAAAFALLHWQPAAKPAAEKQPAPISLGSGV